MSNLSNFSLESFGRYPCGKDAVFKGIAAAVLSAGIGMGVIYVNTSNYWLAYIFIAGYALINGIVAGLLSEIFDRRSRELDLSKVETSELKIKFNQEISQAQQQIDLVHLDKLRAESLAFVARVKMGETAVKLEATTQALLAAQQHLDVARSKVATIDRQLAQTIQEKRQAEADARIAQAKVDEIAHRLAETIQEKLQAEADARFAQAKVAQTDREKLRAEEDIRIAQAKATEIAHRLATKIQEKLQAEEDARFAQAKVAETVQKLATTTQEKNAAQTVALVAQAEVTEIAQKLAATTQEKEDLYQSFDRELTSYEKLQRENIDLKLTISELEKLEYDDNNITENTHIRCLTVSDALTIARQKFAILNIWNNAFATASTIERYLPSRVYTVLEILAEVGDLCFRGSIGNCIPELLRQRGVSCSRESIATMGKYGSEREFPHSGKKPQRMEMHIKVGRKIRIYFDVDNHNQQIIIGYCGQHLRTVTG